MTESNTSSNDTSRGEESHVTGIKNEEHPGSNAVKDPDTWTTGGQPATGAQQSYLQTLAEEAHEELPADLTKADASKKIDELQEKTGRS